MKIPAAIPEYLVILLIVYLCYAFVYFSFNVAGWDITGRAAMMLTYLILSFINYKHA